MTGLYKHTYLLAKETPYLAPVLARDVDGLVKDVDIEEQKNKNNNNNKALVGWTSNTKGVYNYNIMKVTAISNSCNNSSSATTSASASASLLAGGQNIISKPTQALSSGGQVAVITSSSSSRERRIVGGGQQHPQQQQQQQHSRLSSHSSSSAAYKQYYYISSTSRNSGSSHRQQQQQRSYAWLRNPFVVFFMSFLAIGSVRFRVRQFHNNNNSPNSNNSNIKALSATTKRTSVSQKLHNLNKATRTVVASALETGSNKNKKHNNHNHPSAMTTVMSSSSLSLPNNSKMSPPAVLAAIEYVLVEEGTLYTGGKGPRFQRFAALEKTTKRQISVLEWTTATTFVSVNNNNNLGDFIHILKNCPFTAYFFETKGVDVTATTTTTMTASKKAAAFEFVLVEAPELHRFATQTARRAAGKVAAAAASTTTTTSLALLAAQVPFAEQFSSETCASSSSSSSSMSNNNNDMGCVFENLGGDATLIAPKPIFVHAPPPPPPSSLITKQNTNPNDVAAAAISKWTALHDEGQFAKYSHLAAFCRGASPAQVESVLRMAIAAYAQRLNPSSDKKDNAKSSPPAVWFSTSGMGVAWLHFRLDSRPKYYMYSPFAKLEQ